MKPTKEYSYYSRLLKQIVQSTQRIIGPVAILQANKVKGIRVTSKIEIKGDPKKATRELIRQYKAIIGNVAETIANRSADSLLQQIPAKIAKR